MAYSYSGIQNTLSTIATTIGNITASLNAGALTTTAQVNNAKSQVQSAANSAASILSNVYNATVGPVVQDVSGIAQGLINQFQNNIFSPALNALNGEVQKVESGLNSIPNAILGSLEPIFNNVVNGVNGLGNDISSKIQGLVNNIGTGLTDLGNNIGNGIGSIYNNLVAGFNDVKQSVGSGLADVVNFVGKGLNDVSGFVQQGIADAAKLVTPVINDLEKSLASVPKSLETLASELIAGIKDAAATPKQEATSPQIDLSLISGVFGEIFKNI